jgi:transposase
VRQAILARCALWNESAGNLVERANANATHQHRHEGDSYRRIELITGTERRRRWTLEEKAGLVAESLQPGVNVSALARLHGVSRGLLQTWRRAAIKAGVPGEMFVPLRLEGSAEPGAAEAEASPSVPGGNGTTGTLEIEGGGLRVCFSGPVDTAALRLVLIHVRRGA